MTKTQVWRVALMAMVLGVFAIQYQQIRLLERIANAMVVTQTAAVADTGVLVHSFKSGGVTYYVVTTRSEFDAGETKIHWERRHLDDIAAAWQEHEPD